MLDFTKVKKEHFEVKLKDNTKLFVENPAKKTFDEIAEINQILKESVISSSENVERVYSVFCNTLARNKNKVEIDRQAIEENYDINDISMFYNQYLGFVFGNISDPN